MKNTTMIIPLLLTTTALATNDPGTGPWPLAHNARKLCQLDRDELADRTRDVPFPFTVFRHGQVCHEHLPDGQPDRPTQVFSVTKSLGAVALGIAAWQSKDFPDHLKRLSDLDPVSRWNPLYHRDLTLAHVLSMLGTSHSGAQEDLIYRYDAAGTQGLLELTIALDGVRRQHPELMGASLDAFVERHVFAPLGMHPGTNWIGNTELKVFAFGWNGTMRDMGRLGLLVLNGGVWNGERLLSKEWVHRMTHPTFEEANTSYGYGTWLQSFSNWASAGPDKVAQGYRISACMPASINPAGTHHPLAYAKNCQYQDRSQCQQRYDSGAWFFLGLGGQMVAGHPGLDLILVLKNVGDDGFLEHYADLWQEVRSQLRDVMADFGNNDATFCEAYESGNYVIPQKHAALLNIPIRQSSKTITCESKGYQPRHCSAPGNITAVRLKKQLSRSSCGGKASYQDSSIIVRDGCRGKFEVTYEDPEIKELRCESRGHKTTHCLIPDSKIHTVVLKEQLSKASCRHRFEGVGSEVVVRSGCRGIFTVSYSPI